MLGVLGGMGPLASAEFLKTLYEHTLKKKEQGAPVVCMLSDPTIPDRTKLISNGLSRQLLSVLNLKLSTLDVLNPKKIIICCITSHSLLDRVDKKFKKKIISLLDIIIEEIGRDRKKYLMLCTSGTRYAAIFPKHKSWCHIEDRVQFPDERDQLLVHNMIYGIKQNAASRSYVPFLKKLKMKYRVDAFVAGCTELHILSKHLRSVYKTGINFIDPLVIIAANYRKYFPA